MTSWSLDWPAMALNMVDTFALYEAEAVQQIEKKIMRVAESEGLKQNVSFASLRLGL